ncbi:hypothetical protein Nepgr_016185 [Nepenthes gracilis]|uniref:Major facilitator superfamily (MFS) profile domain-containing protein n=1 Tax=Nepenthes gracilis TaxID=150966 RepID=A0AAD3SPA8_NEPGR|nr:hypothetical protein Nepgr_016185 [Nepenthes gracilis]
MRGHQRDVLSPYKRVSSKEYLGSTEDDDASARPLSLGKEDAIPSWARSLPHILVAAVSSLLFGYHLGVVNDTLESISIDLGFSGDTLAEGLVVSTCLGGAFVGSLSGSIADGFGRRWALQFCALPMIIRASMRVRRNLPDQKPGLQRKLGHRTSALDCGTGVDAVTRGLGGMLLGRFLVGTGMGLGPPVAALYMSEVSPAYVRGTFGSFAQIATCLGLMGSFSMGIPVRENRGWWRVCFWVPVIPAAVLVLAMELCVESPHWLFKKGRGAEAEATFEKLLGVSYIKAAIAELSKLDRGEDLETVKFTEIFHSRHVRVVFIGATLFALQQLSGHKFLRWIAVFTPTGAGRPTIPVYHFWNLLFDSIPLCEEKCVGDQRKNA